jgi:hypothetical protein
MRGSSHWLFVRMGEKIYQKLESGQINLQRHRHRRRLRQQKECCMQLQ